MKLARDGYQIFPFDRATFDWAMAANRAAQSVLSSPEMRQKWLRHGETWFVGVDVLPNAADGSVDGTALAGVWRDRVDLVPPIHVGQVSVVYPGYPKRDAGESEGNHRYRTIRFGAHIDGLHAVGVNRRRFLLEPHRFVLGLPLDDCESAPLMVWPGSHALIGPVLSDYIREAQSEISAVDLTSIYAETRKEVFKMISPVPVLAKPGQVICLHRHLLHGIAPWGDDAGRERKIAYFRPEYENSADWLWSYGEGV